MPAGAAAAHHAAAVQAAPQQQPQHQQHHQQQPAQPQLTAQVTNPYQGYSLTNVDMSGFQGVDWGSMYGMGMYV